MAARVCPPWVGYLLLNPLRKLLESPKKILGRFVQEGMTVLELGCGMGYFTLPLARMVGPKGRVVAVEIQPKMLSVLGRRARKTGLLGRIELRLVGAEGLCLEDLEAGVDFAAALHVLHEVPDPTSFLTEVWKALKPGCKLLLVEPRAHVSEDQLERSAAVAAEAGFARETVSTKVWGRSAILTKPLT